MHMEGESMIHVHTTLLIGLTKLSTQLLGTFMSVIATQLDSLTHSPYSPCITHCARISTVQCIHVRLHFLKHA